MSGFHLLTEGKCRATRAAKETKFSNKLIWPFVRGTGACSQANSWGKTGAQTNSCLNTAGILDKYSHLKVFFGTWIWFISLTSFCISAFARINYCLWPSELSQQRRFRRLAPGGWKNLYLCQTSIYNCFPYVTSSTTRLPQVSRAQQQHSPPGWLEKSLPQQVNLHLKTSFP